MQKVRNSFMSAGSATKNPLRGKFFILHFPFKFPGVMTISKRNTEMNHMLLSLILPSRRITKTRS